MFQDSLFLCVYFPLLRSLLYSVFSLLRLHTYFRSQEDEKRLHTSQSGLGKVCAVISVFEENLLVFPPSRACVPRIPYLSEPAWYHSLFGPVHRRNISPANINFERGFKIRLFLRVASESLWASVMERVLSMCLLVPLGSFFTFPGGVCSSLFLLLAVLLLMKFTSAWVFFPHSSKFPGDARVCLYH